MRYIDADKLQEVFKELHGGKRSLLIDTEPTADVVPMDFHDRCMEIEIQKRMNMVEVVRCKDCIYKEECGREVLVNEYDNDKAVDITGFLFYCSYGERGDE